MIYGHTNGNVYFKGRTKPESKFKGHFMGPISQLKSRLGFQCDIIREPGLVLGCEIGPIWCPSEVSFGEDVPITMSLVYRFVRR